MNETPLRVSRNRMNRKVLFKELNERLELNGLDPIDWNDFKKFTSLERASILEQQRIEVERKRLVFNILKVVTGSFSIIGYYLLSHL